MTLRFSPALPTGRVRDRTPLRALPITAATVHQHVGALMDDPRFDGLDQQQRRNRKSTLRYKLLGANSVKRRKLRKAAVERQGGVCLACGCGFEEARPATLQFRRLLSEGGRAVLDNCFAACQPCVREAQIAQAVRAAE